ncbi:MAG: DUF1178 family protein [Rhizobiaceae bacterium]
MIRFALACDHDHAFEGWFRNNDDFDAQAAQHLIECPLCGSLKVGKALMAPALGTSRRQNAQQEQSDGSETVTLAQGDAQRSAMQELRKLTQKMRTNSEYVGDKFAQEARKIHDGDADARNIYGEATVDEARDLMDDGIDFMPIPVFPDDHN